MTGESLTAPRTVALRYRTIAFCLLLLVAVFLVSRACGDLLGAEEVARVTSPDRAVDAVLTSTNGFGATVGPVYTLYVVPANGRVGGDDEYVLSADHVYGAGLQLFWQKDGTLEVRYESADIDVFEEVWVSEELGEDTYQVEVKLVGPGNPSEPSQ